MPKTNSASTGKLVIISGPSGSGKSTVVQSLLKTCELPLELSVSATTRPRRPDEIDGVNYHFLSDEEFKKRIANNEFLEFVEVFGRGHWYGTLREQVAQGLSTGKWIILEIDVEGAGKILKQETKAITVFIHPGSIQELERRLRNRGTETEDDIARRLEVASGELLVSDTYQHIITNQDVEQCVADVCQTLKNSANHISGENSKCMKN